MIDSKIGKYDMREAVKIWREYGMETVPIVDGRMDLGTWQSVFFIELDGPRSKRKIDLTIIGE